MAETDLRARAQALAKEVFYSDESGVNIIERALSAVQQETIEQCAVRLEEKADEVLRNFPGAIVRCESLREAAEDIRGLADRLKESR